MEKTMKKHTKYIVMISIIFTAGISTEIIFLPLAEGNSWAYEYDYHTEVNDVITFDGNQYFNLVRENGFPVFPNPEDYSSSLYFAWNVGGEWCGSNLYAYSTISERVFLYLNFEYQSDDPFLIYWSEDSTLFSLANFFEPQTIETDLGTFENCPCIWIDPEPQTDDEWFFCFAEDVGIVKVSGAWHPESVLLETNVIDCTIPGDVNNDGVVDVLDIVEVVVGCGLAGNCPDCSDVNDDGVINVMDIILMLNIILEI